MAEYDLVIAYRIYPQISKSPAVFAEDKYKLSEFCIRSLRKSLGDLTVKLIVLLDNCPGEYKTIFLKYFDHQSLLFRELSGVGNRSTFVQQIDELLDQDESELVYFAEDDYFYLDGRFGELVRFIKSRPDAHFVTPYDHLSYYLEAYHRPCSAVVFSGARHWRRVRSTCLTFLTTKTLLRENRALFKTYRAGNHDYGVWMALTKFDGLNFTTVCRLACKDVGFLKMVLSTLSFGWRHLLFGKKRRLWAPIPSIATHLENGCLAPGIDWTHHFSENK